MITIVLCAVIRGMVSIVRTAQAQRRKRSARGREEQNGKRRGGGERRRGSPLVKRTSKNGTQSDVSDTKAGSRVSEPTRKSQGKMTASYRAGNIK